MVLISTNTSEYATDTENTKPSEQLGVYLVFKWEKRRATSQNDTQFGTPRNLMKWAFSDDTQRYE